MTETVTACVVALGDQCVRQGVVHTFFPVPVRFESNQLQLGELQYVSSLQFQSNVRVIFFTASQGAISLYAGVPGNGQHNYISYCISDGRKKKMSEERMRCYDVMMF